MAADRNLLAELVSSLKQQRDELQVQARLAQAEVRDEYNRLAGKVDELTRQYEPLKHAVEETAGNVFSALMLAAEEMKAGFDRVRKSIK
jgi:predicted nuclease with TOPRIM domain